MKGHKPLIFAYDGDLEVAASLRGFARKVAFHYQNRYRQPSSYRTTLEDGSTVKVVNAGRVVKVKITGAPREQVEEIPSGFMFQVLDPLELSNLEHEHYYFLEGGGENWTIQDVADMPDEFPNGALYGIFDWSNDDTTLSWGRNTFFQDPTTIQYDHPYLDFNFQAGNDDGDILRVVYQQGRIIANIDSEFPTLVDRVRHSVVAAFRKTVANEDLLVIILKKRLVGITEKDTLVMLSKEYPNDIDNIDFTPVGQYTEHGELELTEVFSALEITNQGRVNAAGTEMRVDAINLNANPLGKSVGVDLDERFTIGLGAPNTLALTLDDTQEDTHVGTNPTKPMHFNVGGDYFNGVSYVNTVYDFERFNVGVGDWESTISYSTGQTIYNGSGTYAVRDIGEISLSHHKNLSYLITVEEESTGTLYQQFFIGGQLLYSTSVVPVYITYFTDWTDAEDNNVNSEAFNFDQELKVSRTGETFGSNQRFFNFKFLGNADENATDWLIDQIGLGTLGQEAFGNDLVTIRHIGVI